MTVLRLKYFSSSFVLCFDKPNKISVQSGIGDQEADFGLHLD